MYVIPLFTSSLVLRLYGPSQTGTMAVLFIQRTGEKVLGFGIAWLLLVVPPARN